EPVLHGLALGDNLKVDERVRFRLHRDAPLLLVHLVPLQCLRPEFGGAIRVLAIDDDAVQFPHDRPQFLHKLVAAHDAGRLLVHDHVHAGRLAGGEGALDGGADLVWLGDELAVAAHPLDDLVVATVVAEHARDHALLAVHGALADGDLAPLAVVADDGDDGDVEAHKGVEVEAVEPEGTVAVHHEDSLVRIDAMDGHAEAGADAERAEGARVVPLAGLVYGQDLRGVADDVAAVSHDYGVLVHEVRHLRAEAQRMDRLAIAGHPLLHLRARLVLLHSQLAEPAIVVAFVAGQLCRDRLEERLRVRLDRQVDVVVTAELDRVGVDLNRLG